MIREMELALDALSRRQKVVAHNLANLDTPNFTRSDVDFFTYMKGVMSDTEPTLETKEDRDTAPRLDGNNVTLEREMFAMTQTDMLYNAVSRFTTDDLKQLQYVVTEGRG